MNKKSKLYRVLACIMAGGMLLLALVGCSEKATTQPTGVQPSVSPSAAPATEPVTLTFWHTYSEGEEDIFLNKVVPAFEEANPGIKIEAIRMPLDGLQQQIITGASGNAAPDVMRMDLTWVTEFAKLGALQDVTQFDGFDQIKENTLKAPMDTNAFNGSYYGLGLDTNTTTSIWNMDLLAEYGVTTPPTTIEELVQLAKEHNDPANEEWVFTIAGTYTWALLPYFWTLGGDITCDDYSVATGYLNSDASVKAMETIAGWYNDGIISHAIIGEQPDAWGGMSGGKYAMISEGPWFFSSNDTSFKSQTTLMPAGDGGSISIVGGQNIVMFKNSTKQEAAWKFMQYMVSDEAQLAMCDAGMIPVTKSATGKMDTSATAYLDAYLEQLETAKPRTPSANWGQIDSLLGNTFETIIRGEASAKDALDQAATQVDALLN